MKITRIICLLLCSTLATYVFLGKFPYIGSTRALAIGSGPDRNVPYNEKYGVLGYAIARDYYKDFEVVERRIEDFSSVKLTISICLVIGVWAGSTFLILQDIKKDKERI